MFVCHEKICYLPEQFLSEIFLVVSLYDLVSDSFIIDSLFIILSSTCDKMSELKTSCWSKRSVRRDRG